MQRERATRHNFPQIRNIARPWAIQKRLNRSRCRLGCWVACAQEPSTLDGGTYWRHLANTTERSKTAVMRGVASVAVAICFHSVGLQTLCILHKFCGLLIQHTWKRWGVAFSDVGASEMSPSEEEDRRTERIRLRLRYQSTYLIVFLCLATPKSSARFIATINVDDACYSHSLIRFVVDSLYILL